MKKTVRLTESDLVRLVKKVINEQPRSMYPSPEKSQARDIREICKTGKLGILKIFSGDGTLENHQMNYYMSYFMNQFSSTLLKNNLWPYFTDKQLTDVARQIKDLKYISNFCKINKEFVNRGNKNDLLETMDISVQSQDSYNKTIGAALNELIENSKKDGK